MIFIRREKTEYTLTIESLKFGEWFTYCGDIFIRLDTRDSGSISALNVSLKDIVIFTDSLTLVKPIPDKDIDITVKVE